MTPVSGSVREKRRSPSVSKSRAKTLAMSVSRYFTHFSNHCQLLHDRPTVIPLPIVPLVPAWDL